MVRQPSPVVGLVGGMWVVMVVGGVQGEGGFQTKFMPCIKPKLDCDPHRTGLYRDADKIIGGLVADPGSTPWLVSLQDTQYDQPVHFCGGSILTRSWVLTSAGCVHSYQHPYNIQVVAGEYDLNVLDGWERVKRVSRVVLHPAYDHFSHDSDAALLRLTSLLHFNDMIQPLPLQQPDPASSHSLPNELHLIAGWGMTAEVSEMSHLVLAAYVPVLSREECSKAYPDLFTHTMICAGNLTHGGLDPCQGDWGGALVSSDGYMAGVSSWSIGCGRPGFPGVYTDVTQVMDWIWDVTGGPFTRPYQQQQPLLHTE